MDTRSSRRPVLVIGILLGAVCLYGAVYGVWYWYSNWSPCGKQRVAAAAQQLQALAARWDDAAKLAGSTSRIALAAPISELQTVKRDTASLQVPECLSKAKKDLVATMNSAIDGYIAFMGNSEAEARDDMGESLRHRREFGQSLAKVMACAPGCQ